MWQNVGVTSAPDAPSIDSAAATGPPLRTDRDFRLFWFGESIAQLGFQVGLIAMPVIAVELLRASEFEVGVLAAASFAAFLLVGLPAGAWVDRWLKRRTMIRANLARAAAMVAVPVLWWADVLAMWQLYIVAAVIGVATVFFDVCYQSYVPILVRRDQVSQANSALETTAQVARIAGPGLGGLALKVIAAPLLMLADAVGYLVSALCLSRVRDEEQPSDPTTHGRLVDDIREGLSFVWRHDLLRRITACTSLSNLGNTMVFTLVPIVVLRTLGFEPWVMGVVFGVGSVGGIVGAAATPWLGRRLGEGTVIPLAAVASGVALAVVPLSLVVPRDPWSLVLLIGGELVLSFSVLAYNVSQVSMRQRICPPRLLGRMNASIRFVVWGVMPISALLSGVLATAIGLAPTLWLGVVIVILGSLPVLFSRLTGMAKLPDAPEELPAR